MNISLAKHLKTLHVSFSIGGRRGAPGFGTASFASTFRVDPHLLGPDPSIVPNQIWDMQVGLPRWVDLSTEQGLLSSIRYYESDVESHTHYCRHLESVQPMFKRQSEVHKIEVQLTVGQPRRHQR